MNKSIRSSHEYLPLRRILLFSAAISLAFHIVFALAFYFGETFFAPSMDVPRPPFRIGRPLIGLACSFILALVLFFYNRQVMNVKMKRNWMQLTILILGSVVITSILSVGITFFPSIIDQRLPDAEVIPRFIRNGLMRDWSLMTIIILTCQLLQSLYKQRVIAVENEMLRSENLSTRFETLKQQMDPHFLFNSLNTLKSLISLEPAKAEDYVQQLSLVLRASLQNKENVLLEEEMNVVDSYCQMMQIRYGDNLRFVCNIRESTRKRHVLPLAVQGLIENAIKHNVISSKQPLTVTIFTPDDDAIVVSNPIQQKVTDETGNGIGLANLSERYRLKWNKDVVISNDGNTFSVTIPLVE